MIEFKDCNDVIKEVIERGNIKHYKKGLGRNCSKHSWITWYRKFLYIVNVEGMCNQKYWLVEILINVIQKLRNHLYVLQYEKGVVKSVK